MADRPNRIAQIRRERKLTQQQLAEKLQTHWITLSKLERGTQKLTWPWMQRIAEALQVPPHRLAQGDESIATVWITGVLEKNGELADYENDQMGKRLVYASVFDEVYNDWYEIEGDTLWPFFKDRDLIGCTMTEMPSELYLDRLVVFLDKQGTHRVGVLGRGSRVGLFNLQVGAGRPLTDLEGNVTHYIATAIFEAPEIGSHRLIINKLSQNDLREGYEKLDPGLGEKLKAWKISDEEDRSRRKKQSRKT